MAYVPTEDEMTVIRSWVGSTFSEDSILEIFDRLEGGMDLTILEILRTQRATAMANPLQSVSLPSGLNVSYRDGVRALTDLINEFIAQGGTDGLPDMSQVAVYRLTRADYR